MVATSGSVFIGSGVGVVGTTGSELGAAGKLVVVLTMLELGGIIWEFEGVAVVVLDDAVGAVVDEEVAGVLARSGRRNMLVGRYGGLELGLPLGLCAGGAIPPRPR